VGKCIVCSKSAGPFYSLHKACYKIYEDTRKCLEQTLSKCIRSDVHGDELLDSLYSCKLSSIFSLSLFESLIKRAWQDQSKEVLKSMPLHAAHANYLLAIVSELEIEDEDVEPYLFSKLANLEHLICINQNKAISINSSALNDEINLIDDESLLWIFEDTLRVEQQRYSEEKQWTVFQSIINNLFSKSRYKVLAVKTEAAGNFAITNRHYYYITKEKTIRIRITDIYSITPMSDGVRIQTTQRDTTPNTYLTGDGRFTYALLRYAQNLRLKS